MSEQVVTQPDLGALHNAAVVPATPEPEATATPEQIAPEIAEALKAIRDRDTIDAYARRMRGTTMLGTRAVTGAGVVGVAVSMLETTGSVGSPSVWFGTVVAAAGTGVATGFAYVGHRVTESGRVRKAEQHQQVVRDALHEPVDVIRDKHRGHKLSLRWYGADEQFAGSDDPLLVERFKKVVDFADQHQMQEIVVSEAIAKHATPTAPVPKKPAPEKQGTTTTPQDQTTTEQDKTPAQPSEAPPKQDQAKDVAEKEKAPEKLTLPNTVTTSELFKDLKGVRITDRSSQDRLARLTPAQAKEVLKKLEAENLVTQFEALATWLVGLTENHPLTPLLMKWREMGKPPEMMPRMAAVMKDGVGRHFSSNTAPDAVRVDRAYRVPTEATVTVDPKGIRILSTPRYTLQATSSAKDKKKAVHDAATAQDSAENAAALQQSAKQKLYHTNQAPNQFEYVSYPQIVGTDMETFTRNILKMRAEMLAKHGQDAVTPSERWKVELALYHTLTRIVDKEPLVIAPSVDPADAKAKGEQTKTVFQRATEERPRTKPFRPGLPHRGKVSKTSQTLEYSRLFWRNAGKKVGAAVLALGVGGGLGFGSSTAFIEVDSNRGICNIVDGKEVSGDPTYKPSAATINYCHGERLKWVKRAGAPAEGVYDTEHKMEMGVLLRAYKYGWLNQSNAQELMQYVDQGWIREKVNDLSQRVNPYGSDRSRVGDVDVHGNPALFNLTPINGASTKGYWPQATQNEVRADSAGGNSDTEMPPYKDTYLEFSDPGFLIAPIGTPLTPEQRDVTLVRDLNLPAQPADMAKPLIKVDTRQLSEGGEFVRVGTDASTADGWHSYPLPVIAGGDIVGATATVHDVVSDRLLQTLDIHIYQKPDGTFHMRVPDSLKDSYINLSYWVDPNASTDLPVRATKPIEASQYGVPSKPLTEVLSSADVAGLLHSLHLPPNASAEQIFAAIKASDTYSFTPYADAHAKGTIPFYPSQDPKDVRPLNELLRKIAEYAEALPSDNCNVAFMIGTIASRGQADGGYINGITGFSNDGDNVLSKVEAHQWAVTSKPKADGQADFLDDTPEGGPGATHPKPEGYKTFDSQNKQNGPDTLDLTLRLTAALLALGAGTYPGYRLTPKGLEYVRRRRETAADTWLDEHEGTLGVDIALLKRMLYAPAGVPIDETQVSPLHAGQRTAREQLQGLPDLTPKEVKTMVLERRADGSLKISDETARRLRTLVAKAAIAPKS